MKRLKYLSTALPLSLLLGSITVDAEESPVPTAEIASEASADQALTADVSTDSAEATPVASADSEADSEVIVSIEDAAEDATTAPENSAENLTEDTAESTAENVAEASEEAPVAATEDPLQAINQQLDTLISAHQYAEAFKLAAANLAKFEGDSTFDFHYGFSAAQSGLYNEALFPFERLVSEFPSVLRYRLELARAYYYLGNTDAAEEQFRIVARANPPEGVQATIDQFLDKIEEKRQVVKPHWSAFANTSAGYDTNFNSATDIDQIAIYDGALIATLNKNDRQKASGYYQLRGNASYTSPLSRRSAWQTSAGVSRKDNASDDIYDLDNLYAAASVRAARGQHQLEISGRLSHYWLGNDSLLAEISTAAEWRYNIRPFQLKTRLTLRQQDNKQNDDLDMLTPELQVSGSYSSRQLYLQSSLTFSSDQGDADYLTRDTLGLSLSAQWMVSDQGNIYGSYLLRDYSFQGAYPMSNAFAADETRNELMQQISLGYSHALRSWASLYTQVAYLDYDSNLDIYQYDRTLTEVGLNLSF